MVAPALDLAVTITAAAATVAYLVAAALGARNYKKTMRISNYWAIFAIAMGLGALLFTAITLKHLGIMSAAANDVEGPLFLSLLVALIIAKIEALTTKAHMTIR